MNSLTFKTKIIPFLSVMTVIAVMIGISEYFNEPEIIFPEITAIAIGALIAPSQVWNTSKLRTFAVISIMSVIGILIVRYIPFSLYVKLPLGFAAASVVLILSGTSFVPLISACMLPIILETKTLIYPISAIAMTGFILIIQIIFEKTGIRNKREYIPQRFNKSDIIFWLKHLLIIVLITIPVVLTNQLYFIVPPIIVAYMELSFPGSKLRNNPVRAMLLIGGSASIGTLFRVIAVDFIGLPLMLGALIGAAIVLLFMIRLEFYLPPAGAVYTLSMLLPGGSGLLKYPVQCAIGCIVLVIIAMTVFKSKEIEDDTETDTEAA